MNGFKIMADSYRKLVEKGELSPEDAQSEIKVLDFLGTCSKDEFCILVDSSAFNEIINAYFQTAINNVGLDKKTKIKLINELSILFDEKTSKEVLEQYKGGILK